MFWFRALIILIRLGPFITTNANELTMFAYQPLRNGHPTLHIAITPNAPLDAVGSDWRIIFQSLCTRNQGHTHKTKNRVTWRTSPKTGGELGCFGRVSSSCSTNGTFRVNLVTNPVLSHKWGKYQEVFTRDDFNFPIVNLPFICSNIPVAPAYDMEYISLSWYDIPELVVPIRISLI
jgi:hypothetical protein